MSRLRFILAPAALLLAACTPTLPPAACVPNAHGLAVYNPLPLAADPDLHTPAGTYIPAGAPPCGAAPASTAIPDPTARFVAGPVSNLSLDIGAQEVLATAIGDDTIAVGWRDESGDLQLGVSRGGSRLKIQTLDTGDDLALAYSDINRLHVAYVQSGGVYYMAADDGDFPDVNGRQLVDGAGQGPLLIAADEARWVHVIYKDAFGRFKHQRHAGMTAWHTVTPPVGLGWPGENPALTAIPDDPATPAADSAFLMSAYDAGFVHIWRLWFPAGVSPAWHSVAAMPVPMGETVTGAARLDTWEDEATGQHWAYAAWVTESDAPSSDYVSTTPPTYFQINPFSPTAISNPHLVHSGLDAAGWGSDEGAHDAGLYQVMSIVTGTPVTASVWGQAWSSDLHDRLTSTSPANTRLQIGLDPDGGTNPNSASVVWSAEMNPLNVFQQATVSTVANGDTTVFLRSRPDAEKTHNEVYFDNVSVTGGTLTNPDFETGFAATPHGQIPTGWQPFFADNANNPPPRPTYRVYAVWSTDGGATWTAPQVVTENHTASAGTTGAIFPAVQPFITPYTNPASVAFFTIYATGDPPPGTAFLRFGLPHLVTCELGTVTCSDAPGRPLFSRLAVRPSYHLTAKIDPFDRSRASLLWATLQTDNEKLDVYTTYTSVEAPSP